MRDQKLWMDKRRDGFAIALAWPETFCKQAGAWYDPLMHFFAVTKNNYYQVGHSAVVLIDKMGKCYYYDFGRYHTPFGFGRVRSKETDSELVLKTVLVINEGKIKDNSALISELLQKKECHGDGKLWVSCAEIVFSKAKAEAEKMQTKSPLSYGPFTYTGTNCSRFVRRVILAGCPKLAEVLKLRTQYTLTASPKLNITSLPNHAVYNSLRKASDIPVKSDLLNVLKAPEKSPHVSAKWFAGEGAGSWFLVEYLSEDKYRIKKYSPHLELESESMMACREAADFKSDLPFQLVYPCNSKTVNIRQNQELFLFERDF